MCEECRFKQAKGIFSLILLILNMLTVDPILGTSDELNDSGAQSDTKWCYMPDHDKHIEQSRWPKQCISSADNLQSPININVKEGIHKSTDVMSIARSKFVFEKYSLSFRGNTVDIKPKMATQEKHDETAITLPNNKTYEFYSFHFHWGARNDYGSEHALDHESFSMEIHLSFYHKRYADMSEAHDRNKDPNSVLSVAVLVQVTKKESAATNHVLEQFAGPLKLIKKKQSYYSVKETLNLTGLFNSSMGISYNGSYTGPKCRKCQWLVLTHPIVVPEAHVLAFRSVKVADEKNNFRKLQPTYHRRLEAWNITYN